MNEALSDLVLDLFFYICIQIFLGPGALYSMISRRELKKLKGQSVKAYRYKHRGKWKARKGERNNVRVPSCSGLELSLIDCEA